MKIKVYILFLICTSLMISCGFTKNLKLTILYKTIDDLKENSPVFLDGVQVGEVKTIKLHNNKFAVDVVIFNDYINSINSKSDFYLHGKGNNTHILIKNNDLQSIPLKSGSKVNGTSRTAYWLDKGSTTVKATFNKGMEKTKEYLKSAEWKKLKSDISHQVDIATKKGKKELDKQLPLLKDKAIELYKDSPEILASVKAYIDSLSNEKK
jgi:hypothetical protein